MPFEDLAFLFTRGWENRGLCRLNFDEAALLYKTVSRMSRPSGVEIGRYHGGSTILLADAVGDGLLESVDRSSIHNPAIAKQLVGLGLGSVVSLITGDSRTVPPPLIPIDFAFIDGDHSYEGVKSDQERWGGIVRPGGMVIHHDMTPSPTPGRNGPQRVFHELMEGDEFEFVDRATSLVVFEKKEK